MTQQIHVYFEKETTAGDYTCIYGQVGFKGLTVEQSIMGNVRQVYLDREDIAQLNQSLMENNPEIRELHPEGSKS